MILDELRAQTASKQWPVKQNSCFSSDLVSSCFLDLSFFFFRLFFLFFLRPSRPFLLVDLYITI